MRGAALILVLLAGGCVGPSVLSDANAACIASNPVCLAEAMRDGDKTRFRRLLDAGPIVIAGDADGDTLVHRAAAHPDPAFLDLLLERGLDPDTPNTITAQTPLMSAIRAERDPQIERLIRADADLSRADRTGNTALHVAAQINDPGKVLRLLRAGAPTSPRNAQGATFQRYLFMASYDLLDDRTAADMDMVVYWLSERGTLEAD